MSTTPEATKGVPRIEGNPAPTLRADHNALADWVRDNVGKSVANVGALPLTGNWPGRTILVEADGLLRSWNGTWRVVDVSHTNARRRIVAVNNTFSSVAAYTDFPQAADKTALDLDFTKRSGTTNLIVNVQGRAEFTSGTLGTLVRIGINIAGTVTEVVVHYPQAAGVRFTFAAVVEISGVSAGVKAIKPQISAPAGVLNFFSAASDYLSYSVTESD